MGMTKFSYPMSVLINIFNIKAEGYRLRKLSKS